MQEITKCETVYKLPSDELIEKLGIDTKYKIKDIETDFHLGGMGYPSSRTVEINIQPIISINKESTTTCSKIFTLNDKEFMEKLGLKGKLSYTKWVDSIRRHEVSIYYEQ